MSTGDLKLTDFPYSNPGYGRKVAVVGVGSAGCRIANQLSRESKLLEHFLYVTCDDHDTANISRGETVLVNAENGKGSPYNVRGLADSKIPEISRHLADSKLVFIIAGLGGSVGSGLAPVVATLARDKSAVIVAVLVMPYNFEKNKHFFAGSTLKQLRKIASGVIVIDNDELLEKDMPLIDAYALVNERIALALNKLLGSTAPNEFNVGLNNVVNFVRNNSYSVLSLGETGQALECRDAVINAVSHFDNVVDKREASKSIVHLCTEKSVTMNDLVNSIGGLSGIMGNGTMQIEYGLSANSSACSTAIVMATGFSRTKFDGYDPVDCALGTLAGNIEDGYDTVPQLEMIMPQQLETE